MGSLSCSSRALDLGLNSCDSDLVAPWHVEFSWIRDQTRFPSYIGRWVLNHWTSRKSNWQVLEGRNCVSLPYPFWHKLSVKNLFFLMTFKKLQFGKLDFPYTSCPYTCIACSVAQSWSTLCDPMDCSPPGFSDHGISGARKMECGLPFPLPGDLPNPGIKPTSPPSPALAGGFFTTKPPGNPHMHCLPHYQHHSSDGTLSTKDETTLTHHNHSKCSLYLRVHSCSIFLVFGQTYNDVYS